MNDPLESAIPVGSGPGTTVPPKQDSNPEPPPATPPPSSPPPPTPPPYTPPPPPPTAPAAARPSGSDKVWAIVCHVSGFFGVPILLPLIVYLAMRDDSPWVTDNAREALNFHLSLLIYTICLIPLVILLLGIPLLLVMYVASLILSIIAAVKASDGQVYKYPLSIRLIRQ